MKNIWNSFKRWELKVEFICEANYRLNITFSISDFEPSSNSSFFQHQKTSYIESSVTITNGTKDNNDEKKLETSDNCDDTREIPILRLSNSHETPKETPDIESPIESTNTDQSTNENEVIASIKVSKYAV